MKKTLIGILMIVYLIMILLSTTEIVKAGTPHGVIGYIADSLDGEDADNSNVNFSLINSSDMVYCLLTDVVGAGGNSGVSNWYAQDVGNCPVEWQVGDTVNISIAKGEYHTAETSFILTANGSDQAPDLVLGSSPMPTATAYQPAQGSNLNADSVTFQLKCADTSGVSVLQLWSNISGIWGLTEQNSSPVNNEYWSTTYPLGNGIYLWAAWCNDSDGNEDWSTNITFKVDKKASGGGGGGSGDVKGNITNSCGDDICNKTSGTFYFACYTWHTNEAIKNVSLYGTWGGGWHVSQIAKLDGGLKALTVNFTETLYTGVYPWNCYVCVIDECFFVSLNNYTLNAYVQGSESYQTCCTDCGCLDGSQCSSNSCQALPDCGDGTCGSGENQNNCCADCGCANGSVCTIEGCKSPEKPPTCGDGICIIFLENIVNCPEDCTNRPSDAQVIPGIVNSACGDKICADNEDQAICCTDCGCPKNYQCSSNKCVKKKFSDIVIGFLWNLLNKFPWIIIIFLLLVLGIILYLVLRHNSYKNNFLNLVLEIGKEIEKKKFNEVEKKSKGKSIDYEAPNKKIEKCLNKLEAIFKKILELSLEREDITELRMHVEKERLSLHKIIMLVDNYKKVVRKERLAFEDDLTEVFITEEIPMYNLLKAEATELHACLREILSLKRTILEQGAITQKMDQAVIDNKKTPQTKKIF